MHCRRCPGSQVSWPAMTFRARAALMPSDTPPTPQLPPPAHRSTSDGGCRPWATSRIRGLVLRLKRKPMVFALKDPQRNRLSRRQDFEPAPRTAVSPQRTEIIVQFLGKAGTPRRLRTPRHPPRHRTRQNPRPMVQTGREESRHGPRQLRRGTRKPAHHRLRLPGMAPRTRRPAQTTSPLYRCGHQVSDRTGQSQAHRAELKPPDDRAPMNP